MTSTTAPRALVALLAACLAMPLAAQPPGLSTDPGMMAARMANGQLKVWITKAATQMNEADYVFKPTPEVRSFGQLIAHIADQNYLFCSAAQGQPRRAPDIEKNVRSRAEILKAMSESMTYCDDAYASLTDERAKTTIQFMGTPMPALAVLIFRTHHNSLHYGNIVTYMRLRGRVPPSTAGMP